MRYLPRALLAGFSGVAVSVLTACGAGGSLLSADQGNTLTSQLNSVQTALAAHHCPAALEAAGNLQNSASSLSGVDSSLSNALAQGAATVLADVQRQCPASPASTPTTTTPTTPTTTQTTTSTPSVTQTTTTPTATTTTPAPTTTTPPPATTPSGPGTTSTGTGGAGIGGGSGNGGSGNGGSGNGGSGNGSGGGGGY